MELNYSFLIVQMPQVHTPISTKIPTYKLAMKMLTDYWKVGSVTIAINTKNMGLITSNLNYEERQRYKRFQKLPNLA
jgi:hypothetical protein